MTRDITSISATSLWDCYGKDADNRRDNTRLLILRSLNAPTNSDKFGIGFLLNSRSGTHRGLRGKNWVAGDLRDSRLCRRVSITGSADSEQSPSTSGRLGSV